MVVSPGKVVTRAPWAQPRARDSSGERPAIGRRKGRPRSRRRRRRGRRRRARRSARRSSGRRARATALQSWRSVECTSRRVVATALTLGKRFLTSSIMPRKAAGSSLERLRLEPWGPRGRGRAGGPPRCRRGRRRARRCGRGRLGLRRTRWAPGMRGRPELRAVVEVEGGDGARRLGGLHGLDDELGRGGREGREDAAGVEPADAGGPALVPQTSASRAGASTAEDGLPVEAAGPQEGGGLVRAVVEDDRRAHALAAVAPDLGDVGAAHAVVLEARVVGLDAGLAHGALRP